MLDAIASPGTIFICNFGNHPGSPRIKVISQNYQNFRAEVITIVEDLTLKLHSCGWELDISNFKAVQYASPLAQREQTLTSGKYMVD